MPSRRATIRLALPTEAGALHELAALTFPLACPPSTTEQAKAEFVATVLSAESFGRWLAGSDHTVLVADVEGQLVGYALLVHAEPGDPDVARAVVGRPTAELSKLYVHPDQHGGGVAAALVEAVGATAAERGVRSVWLGVNIHNARANRFYDKAGFAIVGRKGFVLGEVIEDDWVRERVL